MIDFPEFAPARPGWLVTLADLALLLVGFLLLVQVTAPVRKPELARSFREAFGAETAIPVASAALRFAPGSAAPGDTAALVAWARDAARDPRVAFTVTGTTDGSALDVTGGATLLASDRARAAAAALSGVVPASRLRLATDPNPRGRLATVTLAFAGERP